MKILPIGNHIVVKVPEQKSDGKDLILPEETVDAFEVVSISENFAYGMSVGDLVYVKDYKRKIRLDLVEYYFIHGDDLLGRILKNKK